VVKSCRAFWEGYICRVCYRPLRHFYCREEFQEQKSAMLEIIASYRKQGSLLLCEECQKSSPYNLDKLGETALPDQIRSRLEASFLQGNHHQLDHRDMGFLKALAVAGNFGEALQLAQFSPVEGEESVKRLEELHLISLDKLKTGYWMFSPLRKLLREGKEALQPLFRSRQETEAYYFLKERHLFVYPRVPLGALLEMDQIRDLLKEPWQKSFLLTYECPLVICSHSGEPRMIVELKGSGPEEGTKRVFLREVLGRMRLPLMEL